ncbi:hypothetical protein [Nocardia africana]|uniref:TrbL/VirB6 plasmid conjugal transfer protein n=1 Tax=Nocardia africana TaxID=134964 RepID=A0ABW6NTI1_9NOCA
MEDNVVTTFAFGEAPAVAHQQLPNMICDLPGGPGAVCALTQLGSKAASSAANSAFDDMVTRLITGLAFLVRYAISWWVELPSPQLAASTGEPGPVLASVRNYTSGLQVLLMIAGILFAAARLAMAKRGGVAGEAQESFLIFARAVFASMMFSALITTGTKAGDAFSHWVIFDVTHGDLDNAVTRLVNLNLSGHDSLGSGVLLVIGILGVISMLVQLAMLVVRQAVLILVVAAIPLAAAAAGTGPGSQAYKRMLSWSLAFVLWKPVGALVYAIAFTAAGTKTTGQQQDPQLVLLGMILLLSVTIVLPALMRLVTPAVATLGGGGGAGAALAGGALGIAMGSAGGDRSAARKMTEGENATSGVGGGGPNPPPSGPSGGAGGGRPLSGGTGGGGASPGPGASAGGSGSAGTGGRSAGAGHAGGSSPAAGGAAGAAVMGAQLAGQGVQSASSAVESQTADGWDIDAPGPLEVRR